MLLKFLKSLLDLIICYLLGSLVLNELLDLDVEGLLSLKDSPVVLLKAFNSLDHASVKIFALLGERVAKVLNMLREIFLLHLEACVWIKPDNVSLVIEYLFWIKQVDMVLDKLNLLLQRALSLELLHVSVSISHDRDKHVHENNHNQE